MVDIDSNSDLDTDADADIDGVAICLRRDPYQVVDRRCSDSFWLRASIETPALKEEEEAVAKRDQ